MNNVRHLTVVGILIIGTLGPGAPTAFAAGSKNWRTGDSISCPAENECISKTLDEKYGETVYRHNDHNDRDYEVHNFNFHAKNITVAAHFYYKDDGSLVDFKACDSNERNCSGRLPEVVKGRTVCMNTGVLENGHDRNYSTSDLYGNERCLPPE